MGFGSQHKQHKQHKDTTLVNIKTIGVVSLSPNTQVQQSYPRDQPDTQTQPETQDQDGHEESFYRKTKIRASRPARVALRRLLRENFTSREVRRLWCAQILFFSNSRFEINPVMSWVPLGSAVQLLASTALCFYLWCEELFCIDTLNHKLLLTWVCAGLWGYKYMHQNYLQPLKRLRSVLDQVNADLPRLLQKDGHNLV